MIRTRLVTILAGSLLALSSLSALGGQAHAASSLTGLWFNFDSSAPYYLVDITSRCQPVPKACLNRVFSVELTTPAGNTVGPLPARHSVNGVLSVTLPPPCHHALNSIVCDPVTSTTSVVLTPAGNTLRADIITRNFAIVSDQTEFLTQTLPG
jgi:hypothetical protein